MQNKMVLYPQTGRNKSSARVQSQGTLSVAFLRSSERPSSIEKLCLCVSWLLAALSVIVPNWKLSASSPVKWLCEQWYSHTMELFQQWTWTKLAMRVIMNKSDDEPKELDAKDCICVILLLQNTKTGKYWDEWRTGWWRFFRKTKHHSHQSQG